MLQVVPAAGDMITKIARPDLHIHLLLVARARCDRVAPQFIVCVYVALGIERASRLAALNVEPQIQNR